MQIKVPPDVSFRDSVEGLPPDDVVVLGNNAGIAVGVQRVFSATVRCIRDGSGLVTSKCLENPVLGCDGEVSGVLH